MPRLHFSHRIATARAAFKNLTETRTECHPRGVNTLSFANAIERALGHESVHHARQSIQPMGTASQGLRGASSLPSTRPIRESRKIQHVDLYRVTMRRLNHHIKLSINDLPSYSSHFAFNICA
jgi:hypothetical protein